MRQEGQRRQRLPQVVACGCEKLRFRAVCLFCCRASLFEIRVLQGQLFCQGLLFALQSRVYTGNAQQFFVSMHDLVNGVVGQVLRWRVAAYDDRFAQPRLAHFFQKAFLTQRLFKMGIAATSAYAAIQPTRGGMFWRARFGSEEFVQKGRSAA
mgnify:CR=1 FL=1